MLINYFVYGSILIYYIVYCLFFQQVSASERKIETQVNRKTSELVTKHLYTQPLLSLGLLNHFFCSSVQRPFQIDHFPSDYFASYIRACICKKKFTIISVIYSLFEEFATYYKESVGRNLEETRARNIFISYFLVEQFNVPAKSFTLHCSSVLLVLCNVLSLAYFRDGYL